MVWDSHLPLGLLGLDPVRKCLVAINGPSSVANWQVDDRSRCRCPGIFPPSTPSIAFWPSCSFDETGRCIYEPLGHGVEVMMVMGSDWRVFFGIQICLTSTCKKMKWQLVTNCVRFCFFSNSRFPTPDLGSYKKLWASFGGCACAGGSWSFARSGRIPGRPNLSWMGSPKAISHHQLVPMA